MLHCSEESHRDFGGGKVISIMLFFVIPLGILKLTVHIIKFMRR